MDPQKDYLEKFGRNLGFLSEAEMLKLKEAPIFVAGVGGMGGACLMSLVRMGFENIGIADVDVFEKTNLNRQVFASSRTIGVEKSLATKKEILDINPSTQIQDWGSTWLEKIDQICKTHTVLVNGTDDALATLVLYRKAREFGCTVVDAYMSPLPSVFVTAPGDPAPEERLKYPTVGKPIESLTADDLGACRQLEILYVMVNSSSVRHVELRIAIEVLKNHRPRMSLAPMVITTGNLMAYQVMHLVTGRPSKCGYEGYFFNPSQGKVEWPLIQPLRFIRQIMVKIFLKQMLK